MLEIKPWTLRVEQTHEYGSPMSVDRFAYHATRVACCCTPNQGKLTARVRTLVDELTRVFHEGGDLLGSPAESRRPTWLGVAR